MSHVIPPTVAGGEKVIYADDPEGREPTDGMLSHAVCGEGTISPLGKTKHDGLLTADERVVDLLSAILAELKRMNLYNSVGHEF